MKKLTYRINNGNWKGIEYFRGQTISEGDVIEYAYAAPVVTEEMVLRACMRATPTITKPKRSRATPASIRQCTTP